MKVILLAPTPPPVGGIAGWTKRMLETQLKDNWSVGVVDEKLIGGREVFGSEKKRKISTELKRSSKIWVNLYRSLRDSRTKVVHSNIPATSTAMLREYVCAVITKIFNKKFIIHFRCTVPNLVKSNIGKFIFSRICNISDEIIVLNNKSYEFTKKFTKKPISVIPNFIENKHVIKDKKDIKNTVETVLYTGGVTKSKGCKDIIEVAKKFPHIKFKLAGEANQEILDMSLPNNVKLLGVLSKEEVQKELLHADVFMFVSHFSGEGFSNSLLEAMSYGLPCIVSDWAANKDMIEDKGGFVVPVSDINEMENSLRKIENDKNIRKKQSNWNVSKVKDNYTQTIITSKYVDIYNKLSK